MQLLSPFLLLFTLFNAAINSTRALDFKIQSVIVVDKSGKGNFKTIQAAIDSVPLNNNKWVKIQVNPGVYREKVTITSKKPFIFLQGGDRNTTIITFNDHQQTDTSATFSSIADNIIVRGITFQNSFNLANAPQLFVQSAETFYTQALAARIYGDKSAFIN